MSEEQKKVIKGGTRSCASEERAEAAAKLKACNDRSYARMAEINRIASETLVKTTHGSYTSGQYGQDYSAFCKAMCEIRKIVKDSVFDVAPDYEMLARQFARPCFDSEKLAQAIEALASEQPIDYPTFYTPGWLCELAKKLAANGGNDVHGLHGLHGLKPGDNPCESVKSVDGNDEPAVSGCPSLGPKVFPSGADGTETAEITQSSNPPITQSSNPFYEFYGLKLNRFGGPGLNAKLIGKRVNHPSSQPSVQVFEIDLKRGSLATGARAVVTENGELLFSIVGGKSFAAVHEMAVSALHGLLKRRDKANKRHKRARAAKRDAAAKALVEKELA